MAVLLALSLAIVGRLHEICKPMCPFSSSAPNSPRGLCCLGKDVHALQAIFMLAEITICSIPLSVKDVAYQMCSACRRQTSLKCRHAISPKPFTTSGFNNQVIVEMTSTLPQWTI